MTDAGQFDLAHFLGVILLLTGAVICVGELWARVQRYRRSHILKRRYRP